MIALQAEGIPLVEESIGAATFKRLKVLELGSGCGIVGLSLAQAIPDCDVLLTDLPEAREIAERNIASMNPAMGSKATFLELDWEQPLPPAVQAKPFDLILVADCTYNPDSAPALVQTLTALVEKAPKSIVLLAMKVRHQSEMVFFDLMRDAKFVQKPPLKLVLPTLSDEPEVVLVYVFHHQDRPSYADSTHPQIRKSVVQFWPE
jgi:predicted nicotinamide N-methyase